jgi:predicted metal-binding membrane protein
MVTISRDRAIVVASLAAIAGLAWAYLFGLTQDMSSMDDMPGMAMRSEPASFSLTATMWAVMMVGMMLPSATPMILLFTMVQRKQGKQPVLTTGAFAAGYLVIWGGFAVAAAGLQIELGEMALLSPSLTLVSKRLAGMAFLLAAVYEFSPLKNRCLTQCSSPIGFIMSHWRPGVAGAFRMGACHGVFCVGCCWALMLLLFSAGVMNLLWVAGLAVLVLVQKILPYGRVTTTATGTAMAVIGAAILIFSP